MSQLRKIIFLLFVGAYLIVAPLTVLYALGYIFSPMEQTLLQTGLISLSTEPPRATVQVNGSSIRQKTPLILRNLKPGTYEIQISLPGHHSWQRRVEVKREVATRFENILLFPLHFETEILSGFPVDRIWYVPGGKNLVVQEAGSPARLHYMDLEKKELQPLHLPDGGTEEYPAPTGPGTLQSLRRSGARAEVKAVHLHPTADRALIILQQANQTHPVLVKFTDPLQIKDLTGLFRPGESFTDLKWGTWQKSVVFYLRKGNLERADLERGVRQPLRRHPVHGFTLFDGRLFVLDFRGRFVELTEKGKTREVLLDDPKKARLIFGPLEGEHYSISFISHSPIPFFLASPPAFFLSDKGKLLCNKLPYFLDEGAAELAIAKFHPRAAYRKGNKLWGVDFEDEREDAFFENGPSPHLLYRGKEPPRSPEWHYQDQYLVFREGNHLLGLDWDAPGRAVDLLEISNRVPEFFLDGKRGFLYFIHPDQDRLARIEFPFEGPRLREFVDEWVKPEVTKPNPETP